MPRRPHARPAGPPSLPTVHSSRDHDRAVVARRRHDGTWERIRPGASVDAALLNGPDENRLRALARIVAVHRLAPEHVTEVHGMRVTTPERTVVDCAMSQSVRGGLVVADAALHRGADREACVTLLRTMAGHRGVVRARAVLEVADDGAESPGESLARLALLAAGLPAPQTQIPVVTRLGTFWADFGWPEHRVLVEYDGRSTPCPSTAEVDHLTRGRPSEPTASRQKVDLSEGAGGGWGCRR